MLPDRVSSPGPLTYESGALPTALRGSTFNMKRIKQISLSNLSESDCLSGSISVCEYGNKIYWLYTRRRNDAELTSLCDNDVASTSVRRHFYVMCPLGSCSKQ